MPSMRAPERGRLDRRLALKLMAQRRRGDDDALQPAGRRDRPLRRHAGGNGGRRAAALRHDAFAVGLRPRLCRHFGRRPADQDRGQSAPSRSVSAPPTSSPRPRCCRSTIPSARHASSVAASQIATWDDFSAAWEQRRGRRLGLPMALVTGRVVSPTDARPHRGAATALPGLRWYRYEPVNDDMAQRRRAAGVRPARCAALPRWDEADVVLTLGRRSARAWAGAIAHRPRLRLPARRRTTASACMPSSRPGP